MRQADRSIEEGRRQCFDYAQQPVSTTLNNLFRLRSTTCFDYAQQPVSTTLNNLFRLRSTTGQKAEGTFIVGDSDPAQL
ncbi:MAG: hypothetical protein V7K77_02050 [Nostoc sp.]|uniref:hypothetical protein n=1 Tax=Nostoc sp. TaxID=1180 RepID=UPI002FFCDB4A